MRYSGYESRFGRVQLLKFRHVFQHDYISPLLHRHSVVAAHRNLHIFHLEIALLVVGVNLQRLAFGLRCLLFLLLIFPHSANQTTQQVVAHGYFLSRLPDDVLTFQIQYVQRFIVDKEYNLLIVQTDDRFIDGIDDGFQITFGSHEVRNRAVVVIFQPFGHPIEILRHLFQFLVSPQVQLGIIIMVGYLKDTFH